MNNREIIKLNLKKNWHGYEAFLILIAALEGMMMIYGAINFDFGDIKRKLYFTCYVFLFICSILAITVNRICMKRPKLGKAAISNVCIYNGVLIFWSAVISALDINGGGYPVTYMTILAAVGSISSLPPLIYSCYALCSSAGMIAIVKFMGEGGTFRLHIPFFLNHFIFLLVVIAVETRNYHTVKQQYLLEQQLEKLACIDGLTGISNRRSLDSYMEKLLEEDSTFSFVLLDVDNFKSINDTYGHGEGDTSLISIAHILTEIFGENVFRYGGDEFAVISFENAEATAEKMALVNRRLRERNTEYILQTCSGVYYNEDSDDERRIFERADHALYEAKQNGKARSVIYGTSVHKV
ncbi:MAG: GGDEF domain-containing protein [Huintestinicola sp.]|uniref:GGDEF domain-containing protein n=1 Tax=Huintestinicola sp. TaxID=2981661 RepID=UPI003F05B56C